MATLPNVSLLEDIIRYMFTNKDWAIQALTAAHRTLENVSIDGNRKLATVGSSLIQSVISNFLLAQNGDRAEAHEDFRTMTSYKSLAIIARNSNIGDCIKASPRQKQEELALPPRVLANAIKAIIAAVWKDSGENLTVTQTVMARLAAFGSNVPAALSEHGIVGHHDYVESIDPRMMSMMNNHNQISNNRDNVASGVESIESTNVSLDDSDEFRMSPVSIMQPAPDGWDSGCSEWSEFQDWNELFPGASVDIERSDIGYQEPILSMPNTEDFEVPEAVPLATSSSGMDLEADINVQESVDLANTGHSSLQTATEADEIDRASAPNPLKRRKSQNKLAENRLLDHFISKEIEKWEIHEPSGDEQANFHKFIDYYISEKRLHHQPIIIKRIYVALASSVSVLNLQEVLESHHRGVTCHVANSSKNLSVAQRYRLIMNLGKDVAYFVLLRRYHILMLYKDCLGRPSIDWNSGFVNSSQDNIMEHSGKRGNPRAQAEADVTDAMVREIIPDFCVKSESEQRSLRRNISYLRAFGRRLYLLDDRLGLGVLALLLPSNVSMDFEGLLGISDTCIMKLLDKEFEMLITLLSKRELPFTGFIEAAKVILESILQNPPGGGKKFILERASREEIMNAPCGSESLLEFLRPEPMDDL